MDQNAIVAAIQTPARSFVKTPAAAKAVGRTPATAKATEMAPVMPRQVRRKLSGMSTSLRRCQRPTTANENVLVGRTPGKQRPDSSSELSSVGGPDVNVDRYQRTGGPMKFRDINERSEEDQPHLSSIDEYAEEGRAVRLLALVPNSC